METTLRYIDDDTLRTDRYYPLYNNFKKRYYRLRFKELTLEEDYIYHLTTLGNIYLYEYISNIDMHNRNIWLEQVKLAFSYLYIDLAKKALQKIKLDNSLQLYEKNLVQMENLDCIQSFILKINGLYNKDNKTVFNYIIELSGKTIDRISTLTNKFEEYKKQNNLKIDSLKENGLDLKNTIRIYSDSINNLSKILHIKDSNINKINTEYKKLNEIVDKRNNSIDSLNKIIDKLVDDSIKLVRDLEIAKAEKYRKLDAVIDFSSKKTLELNYDNTKKIPLGEKRDKFIDLNRIILQDTINFNTNNNFNIDNTTKVIISKQIYEISEYFKKSNNDFIIIIQGNLCDSSVVKDLKTSYHIEKINYINLNDNSQTLEGYTFNYYEKLTGHRLYIYQAGLIQYMLYNDFKIRSIIIDSEYDNQLSCNDFKIMCYILKS